MNLALEKGERVTMGGKGRGEIGGEAGEVTSIKFPCVCMCLSYGDLFKFLLRIFPFFSLILCYLYFGTFFFT